MEPKTDNEINYLVAQKLGYILYEWEEECCQFTPGKEWSYGTDSYVVKCYTYIHPSIFNRSEKDWQFGYDKPDNEKCDLDWYSDIDHYLESVDYQVPNFSSDYSATKEIINYLNSDFNFKSLNIYFSNNKFSIEINSIQNKYYTEGNNLPKTLCKTFLMYVK